MYKQSKSNFFELSDPKTPTDTPRFVLSDKRWESHLKSLKWDKRCGNILKLVSLWGT